MFYLDNNNCAPSFEIILGAIYKEILYQTYDSRSVYLSLWENFDQSRRDDHRVMW